MLRKNNIRITPIADRTKSVLHDFVRGAVSRLSEATGASLFWFEDDVRFERMSDGNFHQSKTRVAKLRPFIISDEWLQALPDYEACIQCLQSDAAIGQHIDRLVGADPGIRIHLSIRNILTPLITAQLDDTKPQFSTHVFNSKWKEWANFFESDHISYITVVPIPYLATPNFPLPLNDELVLDRLTEDEVTRCHRVGVLQQNLPDFAMIFGRTAVGIRKAVFLKKTIRRGDGAQDFLDVEKEGIFGQRPAARDDLTIDDVLCALRLFKNTHIRAAGRLNWSDALFLRGGVSYRSLAQFPYGGGFELTDDEVPPFLELWHLLEEGLHDLVLAFIASISRSIAG